MKKSIFTLFVCMTVACSLGINASYANDHKTEHHASADKAHDKGTDKHDGESKDNHQQAESGKEHKDHHK